MSIWFNKNLALRDFNHFTNDNLSAHLGMQFTELGDDYLKASMPVDNRTKQPYGLLHGGASAALAETVGSIASALIIDHEKFICVGLEINANHLRGVRGGIVTALASPLHIGSTTHVWDIRITDEHQKLVCICRLTVAVLKKKESL